MTYTGPNHIDGNKNISGVYILFTYGDDIYFARRNPNRLGNKTRVEECECVGCKIKPESDGDVYFTPITAVRREVLKEFGWDMPGWLLDDTTPYVDLLDSNSGAYNRIYIVELNAELGDHLWIWAKLDESPSVSTDQPFRGFVRVSKRQLIEELEMYPKILCLDAMTFHDVRIEIRVRVFDDFNARFKRSVRILNALFFKAAHDNNLL